MRVATTTTDGWGDDEQGNDKQGDREEVHTSYLHLYSTHPHPRCPLPHHINIICLSVVPCFQWIWHVFPLPTFPLWPSPVECKLHCPIVFLTGPRDAVVDLLGIPSCRKSARIVSSESFMATNALYMNAVAPPTVTSSIPSSSMLWDSQFFFYFLGISGLGFVPVWSSPLRRS